MVKHTICQSNYVSVCPIDMKMPAKFMKFNQRVFELLKKQTSQTDGKTNRCMDMEAINLLKTLFWQGYLPCHDTEKLQTHQKICMYKFNT